MDPLGFVVLLLIALVAVVIQSGLAVGVMYLLHKYMADKTPDTNYRTFNFDRFERKDLVDMLIHLVLVFLIPTVILHSLDYIFVGIYIRKAPFLYCSVLFILETASIALGFYFFFTLDRLRLLYLTSASALIYILVLWLILYYYLSS